MKKIIISMLAMALISFGAVSVAAAQSVFNSPAEMPTLTITNHTTHPCNLGPIDGCWQTSTSARPGDVIAVHIYYRNTSNTPSEGTTLSIQPGNSGTTSGVTFRGGVASLTGPRSVGSASVSFTSPSSLSYMSGTARWYPSANSAPQAVSEALFGSGGFNIGTVPPGVQGVLVANFKVSGDYNPPVNDECRIDSFTADDYNIERGDSTDLNWRTTGCDHAEITPTLGDVSLDGSRSVHPSYTTTYTLTAYPSNYGLGGSVHRSLTIHVDDNTDTCSIDSFTADDYSIERGDSTRLSWRTTGASSVDIRPGYSNRSADGSVTVSPSSTTTYTLDADCDRGGTKTRSLTIDVGGGVVNGRPQAITTSAVVLNSNSARLNGIAIPNTNNATTTAWFEWGTTPNLGFRTQNQIIPLSIQQAPYGDLVPGLSQGMTYYYRAAVQNKNGTAYGEIVPFRTPTTVVKTTTVIKQPPQVIVQPPQVQSNVVVAQSAPSLLELRVESVYDRMCVNGEMDYTISYRNISEIRLENAVLRFAHPKEITYISASRGDYEAVERTITIPLGDINPGEQGTITVHAKVNDSAVTGNLTVATATVVYTNTVTLAQEDAIAYSLITVSQDCPNVLGASVFGFNSFLPDTLIEWLLLILIILALIVLGRQLYAKKQEQPKV